jgi:hypothetical protein
MTGGLQCRQHNALPELTVRAESGIIKYHRGQQQSFLIVLGDCGRNVSLSSDGVVASCISAVDVLRGLAAAETPWICRLLLTEIKKNGSLSMQLPVDKNAKGKVRHTIKIIQFAFKFEF